MTRITDKSRADALTDAIWRLKRDLERGDVGAGTCLVYIADLRTILAAPPVEQHEAAPTWQPIATAPTDTVMLIAGRCRGRPFVTAAKLDSGTRYGTWFRGAEHGGWEWEWDFAADDVTHWMPLPAPPADDGA
ncbi:gp61 [Burkholderia phage Bcep1]|uniref:Gp61 n=1 Tax=Burkholderia phage Bcep1 TaxID=2883943 RepID=Q6UIX1_9CAUD|nr:gp61 [Burkholderia phage Bcep1]AAQ73407.1 gp61 [Burkholderia phage Bcep1]